MAHFQIDKHTPALEGLDSNVPMDQESKAIAEISAQKQAQIIDAIDQIHRLGVSNDIDLPQIVIVGDQSSGKSSMLQEIAHVPFAIGSKVSPRFAIQVDLRRKQTSSVHVSILPSSGTDPETRNRLQAFKPKLTEQEFHAYGVFANVVKDAAALMSVNKSGSKREDSKNKFARHILKFEVFGPEEPHISFVDVPGLFRDGAQSPAKEELENVRYITKKFMENPRSIIVVVMDVRDDIASQEVIALAQQVDKDGSRTAFVSSQWDTIKAENEQKVLDRVHNAIRETTPQLSLMKSESPRDIEEGLAHQPRDKHDETSAEPFSSDKLLKDQCGMDSLNSHVSQIILRHTRKEVSLLVEKIALLVSKTEKQLEDRGGKIFEKRRALMELVSGYQRCLGDTLNGIYDSDVEADSPVKLRWHIRTKNNEFKDKFGSHGHKWIFKTSANTDDPEFSHDSPKDSADVPKSEDKARGDIYDCIREAHSEHKATALPGTINPRVFVDIFRKQTEPWAQLSRDHLADIRRTVSQYMEATLKKLAQDPKVADNFMINLHPLIMGEPSEADEELAKLLHEERDSILNTLNDDYTSTLQHLRSERVVQCLKNAGLQAGTACPISLKDIDDIAKAIINDKESEVHDIHDVVKSYYKVAMRRFLDNFVVQVIERHILGPKSPFRLLSPDFVDTLEDDKVDPTAAGARLGLLANLKRQQDALEIARSAALI